MKSKWSLLLVGLAVPAFAAGKVTGPPPSELADGALSFLISKRCEKTSRDTKFLEWTALTYGPGRPPAWGRKPGGPCRGLDTWVLSEAVTAGAYWGLNDHKAIEASPMDSLFEPKKTNAAFKQMFGWAMPERGDYMPRADVFLKFDAKKVSAVFDRFYVKPAEPMGVVTGQQVYDHFLKDFVTRFAREVALVKSSIPKPQLAKMLKAYQAAAKEGGSEFNGVAYLKQAAATALPKEGEQAPRAGRTLGVVLRRTADGTWPTVNKLLKTIVTDYDPELAKELGAKL